MGYLFLAVSLLAGVTKGYFGKKTGNRASDVKTAVLLNLVRMLMCIGLGIGLIFINGDVPFLNLDFNIISISALSGISTSIFVVSWLVSVRKSAYMMLDIFLMLGSLVPMISGSFLFGEAILPNQWIGFFILVAAVVIMCSYNNTVKARLNISSILVLVLCGFANGVTDFSQKMFVKILPSAPVSIFNLYTYIFAAITLAVFYVLMSIKEKPQYVKGSLKVFSYILIMSVALTAASIFKTKAALYLSSAQLYPLSQGLALVLSTLMAAVFFKEKPTLRCILGILIAFVGLLIMNVL